MHYESKKFAKNYVIGYEFDSDGVESILLVMPEPTYN